MKVLQIHNFYRQSGGEDQVYAAEYELLKRHGHEVTRYSADNKLIDGMSGLNIAIRTIWNSSTYRELRTTIQNDAPDIIHCHNIFPMISPAVYYAAAEAHVPVVQTLHNYRLLCPGSNLFRDGRACESCLKTAVPYKAVLHGCYRESRAATLVAASMLVAHRAARTWKTKVHTYIALTNFSKGKFVEGGLPAQRVVVKPNFLARDPSPGEGDGGYALFIGRICEEKGLRTLLSAWERLTPTVPLKVVGEGPLTGWLQERIAGLPALEWLGVCDHDRCLQLLSRAAFLIFPSLCYEGLPLTIIEAFACGTPVIASAIGSMNELITNGVSGFRFPVGNAEALADTVAKGLSQPERLRAMRRTSRFIYQQNYTAERNYELLMGIYSRAVGDFRAKGGEIEKIAGMPAEQVL